MQVNIIKRPTDDDWRTVYALATATMGKDNWERESAPSTAWKTAILNSEHSPIRHLVWIIQLVDIPYCNSVHFVRHKFGVEHFVKSQRNDRQADYDRHSAPQNAPVTHTMEINAAELMQMARMRLCSKADAETRNIMQKIRDAVVIENPEMKPFLVRRCQYLGRCPEMQSCGIAKQSLPFDVSELKGE